MGFGGDLFGAADLSDRGLGKGVEHGAHQGMRARL